MPKNTYKGLQELISAEQEAKQYFFSLPEYAREQISQRDHNINSFESLRDYAENVLRGDN